MSQIICGVDVASCSLYARVGVAGAEGEFSNTAEGIGLLAGFCREHGVELVVMEATGGYERLPLALLWTEEIAAAVVNPRAVRRYAEAMGSLEKTDRIDAGMIAAFAQTKKVRPTPPPSDAQQRLRALVKRLQQLVVVQTMQRNQRRLVTEPTVLEGFTQLLALLSGQIRDLERQIAALLTQDPLWEQLDRVFRSIKGVADRTVARLLAELPEIGTVGGKSISKLVGLAPLARDSGKSRGARTVRGGRAGVRSILFVVAEVVRRHDPDFMQFHRRLNAAGKPKKVVRVALAHKLLVRLNAKARDVRAQALVFAPLS